MTDVLIDRDQSLSDEQTKSSSQFLKLLALNLKANLYIWLFIIAYVCLVKYQLSTMSTYEPKSFGILILGFLFACLPLYGIAIVVERFVHIAFVMKSQSPIKDLSLSLKDYFCSKRRMANGLPIIIMTFLMANHFGQIKDVIPQINPFEWDETFMLLDRSLHFGLDPWVILQPLMGYLPVTVFIDWMYYIWIVVIYSVFVSAAFAQKHSELRTQFILSFLLIWIVVGNIMAILLSSAGPIFYAKIGLSPDPFSGLLVYLNSVNDIIPLMAMETNHLLWDNYTGGQSPIGGISAMPSMHNCSAILVAIYAWRVNKQLGLALSIFAGIIFLGSIHLGWHYAIDGYVAGLCALLIWWCSGRLATWMHKSKASQNYTLYEKQVSLSGENA